MKKKPPTTIINPRAIRTKTKKETIAVSLANCQRIISPALASLLDALETLRGSYSFMDDTEVRVKLWHVAKHVLIERDETYVIPEDLDMIRVTANRRLRVALRRHLKELGVAFNRCGTLSAGDRLYLLLCSAVRSRRGKAAYRSFFGDGYYEVYETRFPIKGEYARSKMFLKSQFKPLTGS